MSLEISTHIFAQVITVPTYNYVPNSSDEVLEAMALASRTLYEVLGLGLGRQVFGLGLWSWTSSP